MVRVFLFLPLGAIVGAAAFRTRGGWLGDRYEWFHRHGQASRMVYGLLMAGLMLAAGWPWPFAPGTTALFALALAAAWFAGAALWGSFGAIDAGRNEGRRGEDMALNSIRGFLYGLLPALVVAAACGWAVAPDRAMGAGLLPLFGLGMGPLYDLAWSVWPYTKPTEKAECLTGACLGVGAVASVLA